MMKRKSMQICDSVNNLFDVTTPSIAKDNKRAKLLEEVEEGTSHTDQQPEASRIEIDYDSLAQERQSKYEELQKQHMDEKEVEKRKKKRKKLTRRLQEKTKH